MEDTKAAIIKLKMYNQTKEEIAMKESKLALLDESHIKTSAVSDDALGGIRKDIHDRYAEILEKKDILKLELIELKLEAATIDTALALMSKGDKIMCEALEVIKLRHISDKNLTELEHELNMSESTIRRRLNKGEKEFARLLELAV